jgi:Uma2 family endonuclease
MTTTLAPPNVLEPKVSPTRPLGPWANGMELSAAEYDAVTCWDDDFRYELRKGILVVSPAAGEGERNPNGELEYLLREYRYRHPHGACLSLTLSEQEVAVGADRRRMDRAIWIGFDRPVKPKVDLPTIAVEFVSSTSRDRRRDFITKRREYAAIGIAEYWIIDRYQRCLTVFRGDDVRIVREGELFRPEKLPGFELDVARLLAQADAVSDPDDLSQS